MLINMSIYAALLALMLIFLSFRIANMRRKKRIGVGDGGHADLRQGIRAQANFVEYTPFFLILLVIVESLNGSPIVVHLLGIVFLVARILHAYSLISVEKYEGDHLRTHVRFRIAGMVLTLACLLIAAIYILIVWLGAVTAPV